MQMNSVGDLVLTDPLAMRALAHPIRLSLFDRLRRHGAATTIELSLAMRETPSTIQEHLLELEKFGFVTRDNDVADAKENRWSTPFKGFVFEAPADLEGQLAARQLGNVMLLSYVDLPKEWVADVEPKLELEWVRAAGVLNVRVTVTTDELREIQESIEKLLEPFITRETSRVPTGAVRVRILSYFMPEGASDKASS